MPAPFGSSARRLQGDVRGSAERAKRPHSASSGGFQPSRKSFFQSLDADERAALLKVAPSLRCARRRRPRARPFLSPRDRRDRPDAASKRDMRLTLPRPLARFASRGGAAADPFGGPPAADTEVIQRRGNNAPAPVPAAAPMDRKGR